MISIQLHVYAKTKITQVTFLLHMLHHSRNLYKPKRVIFEKKKASLNPLPPKNILMKHFTLYIKCLRINSVEIKKRIGKESTEIYIYIYKSNLSNLKNVVVLLQICMVH